MSTVLFTHYDAKLIMPGTHNGPISNVPPAIDIPFPHGIPNLRSQLRNLVYIIEAERSFVYTDNPHSPPQGSNFLFHNGHHKLNMDAPKNISQTGSLGTEAYYHTFRGKHIVCEQGGNPAGYIIYGPYYHLMPSNHYRFYSFVSINIGPMYRIDPKNPILTLELGYMLSPGKFQPIAPTKSVYLKDLEPGTETKEYLFYVEISANPEIPKLEQRIYWHGAGMAIFDSNWCFRNPNA